MTNVPQLVTICSWCQASFSQYFDNLIYHQIRTFRSNVQIH